MSDYVKTNIDNPHADPVWKNSKTGKEIETFPLQVSRYDNTVPLEVAQEAYKEYAAQFGTRQSLDRLGERGGFGASEIAVLLFERIKRIEEERSQ